MIRSMTGFGRAGFEQDEVGFEVELRSVNHRHLDIHVRLPRVLSGLEAKVRAPLQGRFGRGKVDVSVSSKGGASPPAQLEVDFEKVRRYLEVGRTLADEHGLELGLRVADLLALPGVSRLVEPELEARALDVPLVAAVEEAAEALVAMRAREGEALERDLRGRLAVIDALVAVLESRAGEVQEAARARLRKRSEALAQETGLMDPARLHQEIVYAADRLDITEELVRLRSHIEQFIGVLDAADGVAPIGRRLDFLLQEMGREANTIGSKGSDAPLAHTVVDLKAELERLREQVQNVE